MSLPATIQELVRVIGHGKAMALVREFGGDNLAVPRTEEADLWHALVEVIGEAATRRLAAEWGGEYLYISLCTGALKAERRRKLIARYERLIKEGHSSRGAVSILVREFSPIAYRTVERIINSPLPEATELATQGQLF